MKRKMAMLVAVTAVSGVLVMFAPNGSTAQAALHNACVATGGAATLASGFSYPGVTTPHSTPPLRIHPHSTTFAFTLAAPQCVTPSALAASGEVHGWCGLSIGSGVIHTAPNPTFHWIGLGGTLVLTGEVSGIVNAAPNALAGESCGPTDSDGAKNFIVNGVAVADSCDVVNTPSTSVASVSLGNVSVPGVLHISGHLHPRVSVCV